MPEYKQVGPTKAEVIAANGTQLQHKHDLELSKNALESVKIAMSAQDNVKVIVPAQGTALGYEITCSRETAKRKYPNYKYYDTIAI